MISHHDALIYTMVLVSAADRNMSDAELKTIGQVVSILPIFKGFDLGKLPKVAAECAEILDDEDGLTKTLDLVKSALPDRLHETAYAVACEVAAADGRVVMEEMRLLQMIRDHLAIDRLIAAAIERGARARHQAL